ncbi:MAG: hypothetical protein ABF633_15275 [Clostridium sp.]|uniref:hypothetical protein n=1 Tax=Clostridium sp. TaxID=1506 RepID=UPI0039E8DE8B
MEHLCSKCNSKLTKCVIKPDPLVKFMAYKFPVKPFTKEYSELSPYVCPICGYTEWYAENPEKFK